MSTCLIHEAQLLGGEAETELRWIVIGRGGYDLLKIGARLGVVMQIEIARGEIAAGEGVAGVFGEDLFEERERRA